MFFLFAMISFVTNLAAPLGTIWKNHYEWSGMLGNMMNFLAYLFMGIPAGNMLMKIGYKKTALNAIIIGIIGLVLQYLSSVIGGGEVDILNLIIYLCGAFVCGFCVCMLNTVVNPMLNLLGGGGNRGNQLIQMGGSLNSLAGTLTPFLVGMLMGEATKATMIQVQPLLWIAIGVFVFALIVVAAVKIPEPHLNQKGAKVSAKKDKYSPWSFRHFKFGVIGIFFYVGTEVGIPGTLFFYLSDSSVSGITQNAAAVAGSVVAVYWLLMLVGRLTSSVISQWVSSRTQLITVASVALVLVLLAMYVPSTTRVGFFGYSVEEGLTSATIPVSALLLVLCGLCTSVMWGGIFNLAVEGLGRYTAKASGIFMMMVVGGGVMPLIQNWLSGAIGYMNSYWLVVAMLFYLLYYGCLGSKNVNRNIPVDDTTPDALNL
ncbi:MAG: MFS transporter [Muribaculaceae bacterium]|nr:MFS transporter [Muribaculaceae bacterium]